MDWSFDSASLSLPCAICAAALSSSVYSDCDSGVLAAGAPELQTRYRARTVATCDGRAGMYRSCKKGSRRDRDLARSLALRSEHHRLSEVKLGLELPASRRVQRIVDDAKRGARHTRIRPIPNVAVERVQQVKSQFQVKPFGDGGSLDETEVFLLEGRHSHPNDARHGSEPVVSTQGRPSDGIGVLEGRFVEIRLVGIPIRPGSGGERIEVPAASGSAQDRLAGDLVKPNAVVVARDPLSAPEVQRLSAQVALQAGDLPATKEPVGWAAFVEKLFALSHGKLVDVADHKIVRNILVADALLTALIERVLSAAASSKSGEYGKRA